MDTSGISMEEACAYRAQEGSGFLSDEDFAIHCNTDGSTKSQPKTTTFSVKNSDSSVTIQNNHLYIGLGVAIVIISVLVVLLVKKLKARKKSN